MSGKLLRSSAVVVYGDKFRMGQVHIGLGIGYLHIGYPSASADTLTGKCKFSNDQVIGILIAHEGFTSAESVFVREGEVVLI